MSKITMPNLFKYATSELSQDAMICYLLEWAKVENKEIDEASNSIGQSLLDGFFKKSKIEKPKYKTIEIKQQENKIDVLCIINNEYYIIIEDKTDTSHHNDQLQRYLETIIKKGIKKENILKIYYKTGEEFNLDKLEGYVYFTKEDILEALSSASTSNQIILDYKYHIESLDTKSDFESLMLNDWNTNTWISFIRKLKNDGIRLGENITHGRGQNKGIYFNYEVIESDKVGFYLRMAFESGEIEFKLENKGNMVTKEMAEKYYKTIEKKCSELNIKINRAKITSKETKTKTVATVNESVLKVDNHKLKYDETKQFIKNIIDVHNNIVFNMRLNKL